jgi:hypothetical protein
LRLASVLAIVLLAALAGPAHTSAETAEMARAAADDPATLAELTAVAEIDGVPVDMAALLEDDPQERLAALAVVLDSEPVDREEVEDQIEEILSNPAYRDARPSLVERLLGPVYDWAERAIAWAMDRIGAVIEWVLELVGGPTLRWLGPLVVIAGTAAAALVLGRRRAREIERQAAIERILQLGTDPSELERLADRAAERDDYAEAIRLRFVAGLLRLDTAGRIDFYPGLSNALIAESLGSPEFDRLSTQFDLVVYGRRVAGADDLAAALAGWRALLGVRV